MENQSLYRKYRPKTFTDLAGHKNIVEILTKQLSANKATHAYIFTGQRGTGKTSVARIFAKSLNCLDIKNGLSCENCYNCLDANSERMGDLIEIDAASNNGVDEIRSIRDAINSLPIQGKYKIYIIDEIHMLTKAAFNALLKTLEEPPTHVKFILATTDFFKIPATIVSRCQVLNFKKINKSDLIERLDKVASLENKKIDTNVLNDIYNMSEGSLRDALNILEQLILIADDNTISINELKLIFYIASKQEKLEIVKNIVNKNTDLIISFFEKANKEGMDFDVFTLSLIEMIKEIIQYKLTNKKEFLNLLDEEDTDDIDDIDLDTLFVIVDNISDVYYKTKRTNLSYNYLLLSILKSISNLQKSPFSKEGKATEKQVETKTNSKIEEKHIVKEEVQTEPKKFEDKVNEDIDENVETFNFLNKMENKYSNILNNEHNVKSQSLESIKPNIQQQHSNSITEVHKILEVQSLQNQAILSNTSIKIEENTIEEYINVITKGLKTKTEEIARIVNSWFDHQPDGSLKTPYFATLFNLFFKSKVIVASQTEIIIKVDLPIHARLIKKELKKNIFRDGLKNQFKEELIILPIYNEQWEQVKKIFSLRKKSNQLKEHLVRNPQEYYAKLEQADKILDKQLMKATELFGFNEIDIEE